LPTLLRAHHILHVNRIRVKIQNRLSEPNSVKNGVRQGDALACLLFYVALEKIIRDTAVNMRGTIFYKSVKILAYADDIDIIGRTQSAMIEEFSSLEKAAKGMNLFINPYLANVEKRVNS
jgi:hypothetical protein